MKTFLSVFAAILAAAAVILAGIYAKARLDQWEYAKQTLIAEMSSENAASKAISDSYMAAAHERAVVSRDYSDVAAVTEFAGKAIDASQQSLGRIRNIEQQLLVLFENKPFGLPLTTDEQRDLNFLKGEIAPKANLTPAPTPDQAKQDDSMKPTTEASEAERRRRREAQEVYPHAKAVSPREMVTAPTPH